MKKLTVVSVFILLAFFMEAQTNFAGNWQFQDSTTLFELYLEQSNLNVTGSHSSVTDNGKFIDAVIPGDYAPNNGISIKGTVVADSVVVSFFSSYANSWGKAVIKKTSNTQIHWKIIKDPNDAFYIPLECTLKAF